MKGNRKRGWAEGGAMYVFCNFFRGDQSCHAWSRKTTAAMAAGDQPASGQETA